MAPVGNSSSRTYYRLKGDTATIEQKDGDNVTSYDYIEGNVAGIEYEDTETEQYHFQNYKLIFSSEQGEEVLQFTAGTVASNAILNSLVWSLEEKGGIGWIKLRPYIPDGKRYSAVWMEKDGERMEWLAPPEKQPDDADKRQAYFHRFFEKLEEHFQEQETAPVAAGGGEVTGDLEDLDDDLPF